jgi:hypothetical protein
MKFKILPKVSGFTDAEGTQHLPGEIVELPESYKGETWLKPVEENAKISTLFPKAEDVDQSKNPLKIPLKGRKLRSKTK